MNIAESLEIAAKQTREHQEKRAQILNQYPDGYKFKIGRSNFEKQTVTDDVFWVGPKTAFSSRQMAIELGTLLDADKHFSFALWHVAQGGSK